MVLRVEKGSFQAAVAPFALVVHNERLTPAAAEVHLLFQGGGLSAPELRGRLVGPRCLYASTIEVAYPVRPLPGQGPGRLGGRIIIPEPSFWEPACPFLYEGPVELWDDGRRVSLWHVSHGLRSARLGRRGLYWNEQPLLLRGLVRSELAEGEAQQLRQAGLNTLLISLGQTALLEEVSAVCEAADRLGFLVLARLPNSPDALRAARLLDEHASLLGWLLPQALLQAGGGSAAALAELDPRSSCLVGVELTRPPAEKLCAGVSFICCPEELLPALESLHVPKLVLTRREPPAGPASPGILGWVHAE
jgi:hypothetical protein